MFKNLFSSTGRIGRLEYGLSVVLYLTGITILDQSLRSNSNSIMGFLYLPLFWFLFAQGAKRCHDVNKSGWYQIIPFYFLWMVLEKGTAEANDYGSRTGIEEQPFTSKPVVNVNGFSVDNTVYHKPQPHYNAQPAENVMHNLRQQRPVKQQTTLEVANVNYALTQDVLKKLRMLGDTNSLSYTLSGTTAAITVNHNNTTQSLMDNLYRIMPHIEVREVKPGSISIKIK